MIKNTSPLTVKNVSKTFRGSSGEAIKAVQDVSFTVERGEVVAFLGPNGAGTVSYTHLTLPTKA